jgi:hypothetical protein
MESKKVFYMLFFLLNYIFVQGQSRCEKTIHDSICGKMFGYWGPARYDTVAKKYEYIGDVLTDYKEYNFKSNHRFERTTVLKGSEIFGYPYSEKGKWCIVSGSQNTFKVTFSKVKIDRQQVRQKKQISEKEVILNLMKLRCWIIY